MQKNNIDTGMSFILIIIVSILVGVVEKVADGAFVWLFSSTVWFYTPALVNLFDKKHTNETISLVITPITILSLIVSVIWPLQSVGFMILTIGLCFLIIFIRMFVHLIKLQS